MKCSFSIGVALSASCHAPAGSFSSWRPTERHAAFRPRYHQFDRLQQRQRRAVVEAEWEHEPTEADSNEAMAQVLRLVPGPNDQVLSVKSAEGAAEVRAGVEEQFLDTGMPAPI